MQRELTITIDEYIYEGLHRIMEEPEISSFIEALVRPHVLSATSNSERGIVDILAMPEAFDIDFEPPHLDTELYRKSEAV